MKQKNEKISRVLALMMLLALASGPQFIVRAQKISEGRNINVNEALDLRALGIDNEARQIVSLVGANAKFFKRSSELQQKDIVSPRDASDFKNEGDLRKTDVLTIKRELESLINKMKQGNHWNEAFDAQFLASLKSDNVRSLLTQSGGARKLFQSAVEETSALRDEVVDEVRQINSKQTGALRNRGNRLFAAHARPPVGKVCTILLVAILLASYNGIHGTADCLVLKRYNEKGCVPGPAVAPDCN
ncbi:MAG TPA: hypothetical protein VGC60_19120 [Pyrinomonadaceae bacterium]|jgi:hypothetical protein